jgi:hypothetical protein
MESAGRTIPADMQTEHQTKTSYIMNKNFIQCDGGRSAYASPSVRTCKCVTERGFAQSSDFNDLDFENRDEE